MEKPVTWFDALFWGFAQFLGHFIPPVGRESDYIFNDKMPNQLPELSDLIEGYYRGVVSDTNFEYFLRQLGFDTQFQEMFKYVSQNLLPTSDAIAAWRRGIIKEGKLDEILKQQRFKTDTISDLKKVTEYFPSVPDLVRFAVREVYTPSIVSSYQMYSDLPDKYIQEAFKAGLNPEQAKNYWAAHWELPSVSQGFEMLHRDVISHEELDTLMRTLDIMPFWRDKLKQISYTPLTRVDVRRMYALGVLDETGVTRAYKDIGYNDKNAQLMTEFTIKYETDSATGLTKSNIISAYKKAIISESDAMSYLAELGYTEQAISLAMATADYELLEQQINDNVEELRSRYRLGILTIETLRQQLNQLDLPSSFVEKVISEETLKISEKVKLPSKTDIERWLKLQIINENQYSSYMKKIGYRTEDIVLYLEEIAHDQDTTTRRFLPITTYVRWLKTNIMTDIEFRQTATDMKVSTKDIDKYIKESGAK